MDQITRATANGLSVAVLDTLMFSQPMNEAIFDGLALAGSSIASSYVTPQADSIVPSGFTSIVNIGLTGAIYAGVDSFITKSSPFTGFLPTALWGVANVSLGSNTVYPIISLNTLFA